MLSASTVSPAMASSRKIRSPQMMPAVRASAVGRPRPRAADSTANTPGPGVMARMNRATAKAAREWAVMESSGRPPPPRARGDVARSVAGQAQGGRIRQTRIPARRVCPPYSADAFIHLWMRQGGVTPREHTFRQLPVLHSPAWCGRQVVRGAAPPAEAPLPLDKVGVLPLRCALPSGIFTLS